MGKFYMKYAQMLNEMFANVENNIRENYVKCAHTLILNVWQLYIQIYANFI